MKTLALGLSTGKQIEVDYKTDQAGRVFSVEVFGSGTFDANAGLSDIEAAEVRAAIAADLPVS